MAVTSTAVIYINVLIPLEYTNSVYRVLRYVLKCDVGASCYFLCFRNLSTVFINAYLRWKLRHIRVYHLLKKLYLSLYSVFDYSDVALGMKS